MANKGVFSAAKNNPNMCANEAGGVAYKMSDRQALAQIACTNCFNGTYYSSSDENLQLAKKAALALKKDPEFIAKVAVYSREKGYMKDMPAFLTVVLADIDKALFRKVFKRVIDNGKMLRNFCQMARSGAVNRVFNLSAGTCRHAIQEWFDSRSPHALFKASIGNDPSMRDILRMARPRPNSAEKEALYGYFCGKNVDIDKLPEPVKQFELFKQTKEGPLPNVDFRMLDSLGLSDEQWAEIARHASWQMTRMNLNTFARHNVFKDQDDTQIIADRLRNPQEVANAKQFPYQLFMAWKATESTDLPASVKNALQDAMEMSIDNVPEIAGKTYVCVDMSGSMTSPITGHRAGSTTDVTCADVASLIASSIIRRNQDAEIWTFDSTATKVNINPRDTVFTNAAKLSNAGGGTNISAPLSELCSRNAVGDTVIYVSDCESWVDSGYLLQEWGNFKRKNPNAKLVCIDLLARANSQVKEREDILQVAGWSDDAFNVLASFLKYGLSKNHWVEEIEKISL